MNSQSARFFFYMKSGLKVKRRRKKRVKSREKNFKKNFWFRTSTWRDEMSLIKVAYLMLNFLNLKSFSIHLFFWVASSLSTLCDVSWCIIEKGHSFEWNEDHVTVFLKWTDLVDWERVLGNGFDRSVPRPPLSLGSLTKSALKA